MFQIVLFEKDCSQNTEAYQWLIGRKIEIFFEPKQPNKQDQEILVFFYHLQTLDIPLVQREASKCLRRWIKAVATSSADTSSGKQDAWKSMPIQRQWSRRQDAHFSPERSELSELDTLFIYRLLLCITSIFIGGHFPSPFLGGGGGKPGYNGGGHDRKP